MTEEELAARSADLDKREAALARRIIHVDLATALATEKCRPDALQDAAALMAASAAVDLAEDGLSVARVTLGNGEAHGTAAAARAFLKARPFLLAPDNATAVKNPTPPTAPRAEALINAALSPAPSKSPAKSAPTSTAGMSPLDLCERGWSETPE